MAATVVSFSTIPKSRVDGGDVRFFPVVTGNTTPIVAYAWDFGDGATSADPSPTHTFGATQYTFRVSVVVTDAATLTSNTATADFIVDIAANVPAVPNDGSYTAVTVALFNNYAHDYTTKTMLVNRSPTSICSMYLLNPKIVSNMDVSGTATFSLIVPRTSTATERSFIVEGMNVAIIQGYDITFTGVIRRVTQATQGLFGASTPIKVYDIECDSDLMKLSKMNVISTSLQSNGATIVDSPGNIARKILDVVWSFSDYFDWRGDIMTTDQVVEYQVNPSTVVDQVPSQYDQLMSLQTLTNYDLIVRSEYYVFDYSDFSYSEGTEGYNLTLSNINATTNAFQGRVFFITGSPVGITEHCVVTSSTDSGSDTVIPCVFVTGNPAVTGTCIILRQPKVDFAPNLSTSSSVQTFSVNKDVFGFSDNDDKRKLYTKVIAKGKDLQGNNISVAVAAVHAYDYDRQFYNQSTFISRKSEGYIYKNNFAGANKAVTALPGKTVGFTTNYAVHPTKIYPASDVASYAVDFPVVFLNGTGMSNLKWSPQSLVPIYYYYVVSNDGSYIEVSDSIGGTALDLGSDEVGGSYIESFGKFQINNSDSYLTTPGQEFFVTAATLPSGMVSGEPYGVVGVPGTSTTEKFNIQRKGIPWYDAFSTAGTTVIMNKLPLSGMSELGTTPVIWLYGWGYTIPTGTVMAASVPGGTATAVTTTGAPVEGIDTNGVKYTQITLTSWLLNDFTGRGFLLSPRLYVDSYTVVGNNEVLIGEEKITITASGKSTTYGNYIDVGTAANRITSATNKCYPHDVGALVARTTYTEAAPETGSVYLDYGCRINTATVETNTTYGKLDSYATALLLGFGSFYKKATCWMPIYNAVVPRAGTATPISNRSTMPRLGDVIGIIETTGATPVDYQIVGININYDEGKVELQLGDYEKNIFTSLQGKTSGLNQTIT